MEGFVHSVTVDSHFYYFFKDEARATNYKLQLVLVVTFVVQETLETSWCRGQVTRVQETLETSSLNSNPGRSRCKDVLS